MGGKSFQNATDFINFNFSDVLVFGSRLKNKTEDKKAIEGI